MKYYFRLLLLCILCTVATASHASGVQLVVGASFGATTLDPHASSDGGSHNACNQIFEGLVALDEKNNAIPLLAEQWEALPDQKGYTFFLKKGVRFHNGEILTAEDVLFSFSRASGPKGHAIKALSMYVDPAGLEIIDDHTITIRTSIPMGESFLASLSHPWASILNKKAVEFHGDKVGSNPIGTGSFKLEEWLPGDRAVFSRFEDYHGNKARLQKLVLRTIPEASIRTMELEQGTIDIALDPSFMDVDRIKKTSGLHVVSCQGERLFYLSFEMNKGPYNRPKVREAMNLAINRKALFKAVFKERGEIANGPISSAIRHNRVKETPAIPHDLKLARQFLAEAGYPQGFSGKLVVPDRTDLMACATVLKNCFNDIGISMNIQVMDWATYNDYIRTPGHEPFLGSWWGAAPAPDGFFFMTPPFHSAASGATNRSFYKNVNVDKWLDESASLPEGPERAAVLGRVWDQVNKDLPWLNLATPDNLYGVNNKVKGIRFSSGSINYFGNAYFGK